MFRTIMITVTLVVAAFGATQPARADAELNGTLWNGVEVNGIFFNGAAWNGGGGNGIAYNGYAWNGYVWNGGWYNGVASDAQPATVIAIELPPAR
ncbi:hypothetical protein [Reyranella sp. CPCC 100927]|uniref:hypothetical protein n=1 Tax=Reyranella sp. CPCC 100927 TaxID=2599616 RepID=UPI0011B6974E|nr:hypothetical protein [Reyranella sp. CPCC 100927]TWT09959.1 hypothetical protein FQU96_17850 [Reyranella sp. CPCC 100927]